MIVRAMLLDVEGTTSDVAFVRTVLFPYARARLAEFVGDHAEAAPVLDYVRRVEEQPDWSDAEVVAFLETCMDEDRKYTPLMTLQGMIWRGGYEDGELRSHVYPDVPGALRRWSDAGLDLYVYSSGSVEGQQLLFAHTIHGDLSALFRGHFDTLIGGKLETSSYSRIAEIIGLAPADVLFLSDHPGEVDAARRAGMQALRVDRDGHGGDLTTFDAIPLSRAT